jgi:hypothetical protein
MVMGNEDIFLDIALIEDLVMGLARAHVGCRPATVVACSGLGVGAVRTGHCGQ